MEPFSHTALFELFYQNHLPLRLEGLFVAGRGDLIDVQAGRQLLSIAMDHMRSRVFKTILQHRHFNAAHIIWGDSHPCIRFQIVANGRGIVERIGVFIIKKQPWYAFFTMFYAFQDCLHVLFPIMYSSGC